MPYSGPLQSDPIHVVVRDLHDLLQAEHAGGGGGEASSSMDTAHSQRTKSTTGQTQQHTRGRVSNGQTVITGGSAVVTGESNTYLSHFHPAW